VAYAYAYYTACGEAGLVSDSLKKVNSLAMASAAGVEYFPPPPEVPYNFKERVKARADRLFLGMMSHVIGHEAGHFTLGHVARAYTALGLDPYGVQYIDIHKLAQLYRSREQELEADTVAAAFTVANFGQDGKDAIKYFCIFMSMREQYEGVPDEYLCTHPHWTTRLAWMQDLLERI